MLYYCTNQVNQYRFTDDAPNTCPEPTSPTESFGYDVDGNLISDAPAGPKLVAARSYKTHGTAGEFYIDLPLASPSSAGVECRTDGPTTIELEFSEEVTIDTPNLVMSSGTPSGVTQPTAGVPKYRLAMSGADTNACLSIMLRQVTAKASRRQLVGTAAVYVVVLKGDVDANNTANGVDYTTISGLNGQSATQSNFRCDLTVDGVINASDLVFTQNVSASCTLPPAPLGLAYTWDAENRLTQVVTRRDPANVFYLGDTKVEFAYDYMSRRARKTCSVYNGSWQELTDQLFVYDGWNVVEVLDANASNAVLSKYTWGLDMSGQAGTPGTAGIHGAGGISGLLASVETGTTGLPVHWYFYDANGNVGQVLDATNTNNITKVAEYEYDPYGNTLSATGTYAAANPFRFSTKWFDTETGLSYYGYRYYNARLGRWMSRDPIEEEGGLNLYVCTANSPVDELDPLGLALRCVPGTGMCYWEPDPPSKTPFPVAPPGTQPAPVPPGNQPPPSNRGVAPRSWVGGDDCPLMRLFYTGQKTLEWAVGVGGEHAYYGPDDWQTKEMQSSPGVSLARQRFRDRNRGVRCCGELKEKNTFYDFGIKGLVNAGTNSTRQFVGSHEIRVAPAGWCNGACRIRFVVFNITSFQSASYHLGPSWPRLPLPWGLPTPGGDVDQIFEWFEWYPDAVYP